MWYLSLIVVVGITSGILEVMIPSLIGIRNIVSDSWFLNSIAGVLFGVLFAYLYSPTRKQSIIFIVLSMVLAYLVQTGLFWGLLVVGARDSIVVHLLIIMAFGALGAYAFTTLLRTVLGVRIQRVLPVLISTIVAGVLLPGLLPSPSLFHDKLIVILVAITPPFTNLGLHAVNPNMVIFWFIACWQISVGITIATNATPSTKNG